MGRMSAAALALLTCVALTSTGKAQMPKQIEPAIVETNSGTLSGEKQDDVLIFRGVPYAAPPVGELRWRPPAPVAPWSGVRAATAHEPGCTQPVDLDPKVANYGGVQGAQSEDCLYLTIYAPPGAKNAPVIVWYHGGAFFLGAGHLGSYDGTANARHGVITVSVNYRLGALANFLHPSLKAETEGEPLGNYALQDSVAALEWVRDNIAAFGGNPENVTIAGQSAGGGLVTGLLAIPAAEGLFDKAIVQSGSLLLPDREPEKAREMAVEALKTIGIAEGASAETLRGISAQTFAASQPLQRGFFFTTDPGFKPVATIDALKAGSEIDVPLLVGSNSGEGGFKAARTFATLAGDEGAPAFLYRFEHVPAFRTKEWTKGPIHSAELMFTFDSIEQSSWGGGNADEVDHAVAERLNSCWVAFAKMATSARDFTCADGFTWKPYAEGGETAAIRTEGLTIIDGRELPNGPPAD